MSSLWTPDGEHDVPREPAAAAPTDDAEPIGGPDADLDEEELDEPAAELRKQLDEARRRLASVPAAQVVANHAMGLFELAAIHLGTTPPQLADAALAIDALGALVDGLGDRLEGAAPTLRDALAQIRLAFVQVQRTSRS
jgi:hypothetical protein